MSKKKKNGHKKHSPTEYILLVTVILQLIQAAIELISKLIEWGKGQKPQPYKKDNFFLTHCQYKK